MRVMGLEAISQKPNTSQGHPDHEVYPYLLRSSIIDRPSLRHSRSMKMLSR